MIIDAHAHIMTAVQGRSVKGPTRSSSWGQVLWGDDTYQLLPPYNAFTAFPAEALLAQMDWAGVERAVLLQGPFYGELDSYVASAVRKRPDRFVGAFAPDPLAVDARSHFRQSVEEYGLRIVKFEMTEATGLCGRYPDLRIDAPQFSWIFEAAQRERLVVTFDLGNIGSRSYQTDAVGAIAERYPELQIVIAHLAQPPLRDPDNNELNAEWRRQLLLGRRANVAFDLAALPVYADPIDEYPFHLAQAYIRRAVDLIGADKLMWGSDAPGLLTSGTYPQLLNYLRRHCDFLSGEDMAGVLGGNAWRVYWSA